MENNVYLLSGPEEGERANFLKELIKKKSDELKETPEIYRYYVFETEILDVVTLLASGSLFCSYKFVVLYNAEQLKKASDIALLAEYCEHPSDSAALVLITNQFGLGQKKLEGLIPAKNKKIFWELNENQKRGWVMNYFSGRNLRLEPAALDFLLEVVESNTRDLKKECNKLLNFFAPGYTVTSEDIEQYVYHSKQENVFTLFDRIAGRNFPLCLEVLDAMLLSGEDNPVAIMSGLAWQFKRVLQYKELTEKNYNSEELFKTLGLTSKKNQRICLETHKNYSRNEIVNILVLISDSDAQFRSFKQEVHTLLLQLFLYHVVIGGGVKQQAAKVRSY